MPKLILDLDATVFIAEGQLDGVHPSTFNQNKRIKANFNYQKLKEYYLSLGIEITKTHCITDIYIINPKEISNLINTACEDYDGVMLFTSGCWDVNIRNILSEHLDLSEKSTTMLQNCQMLSIPLCLDRFPKHNLVTLSKVSKEIRWQKYIEQNENLSNEYFVFLDDNEEHLKSFEQNSKFFTVHAKTHTKDKSYYLEATKSLEKAQRLEVLSEKRNNNNHVHKTKKHKVERFGPYRMFSDNSKPNDDKTDENSVIDLRAYETL